MAVMGWRETAKGSGVSGRFGDSHTYTRSFIIRVDHPSTSKVAISQAPGIRYGSPYPDQTDCVAMEFDCSMADDVGLWWTLTVRYYMPPQEKTPIAETGLPEDVWQASGAISTGPAYLDSFGEPIINSAGDPLEGIQREEDDLTWTLTRAYEDTTWMTERITHSNRTNNDTWLNRPAGDWKVNFRSASKRRITRQNPTGGGGGQTANGDNAPANADEEQLEYWEVVWEFRLRVLGWREKPWDIGFNQRVDSNGEPDTNGSSRAAITGRDGKTVRKPVALENGIARQVGMDPLVAEDWQGNEGFKLYLGADFSIFGEPE